MKKLLRVAAACSATVVVLVAGAGAAAAHITEVRGEAVCSTDGQSVDVTWTVGNRYALEADIRRTGGTEEGDFAGLPATVAAASETNVEPFPTVTAQQTGIPLGSPTATLTVEGTWADGFTETATGAVSLPATCAPPAVEVTPVAPEVLQSQECEVPGTATIPATEGVTYTFTDSEGQVPGVDVTGTTLTGPRVGTLTAAAKKGYVLAGGAETTFAIDLKAAEECAKIVTPVEPKAESAQECDVAGSLTVPNTPGVRYMWQGQDVSGQKLSGPLTGTMVALATPGHVLAVGVTAEWAIDLDAAQVCLTPVAPSITASTECEVPGSVTIPDTAGVTYLVDGKEIEPGTYEGPARFTVTAEARDGSVLTGTASWDVVLREAAPCDDDTPPAPPTTPPVSHPPLAYTGAGDTLVLSVLGATLLLLGGALVLFTRRQGSAI